MNCTHPVYPMAWQPCSRDTSSSLQREGHPDTLSRGFPNVTLTLLPIAPSDLNEAMTRLPANLPRTHIADAPAYSLSESHGDIAGCPAVLGVLGGLDTQPWHLLNTLNRSKCPQGSSASHSDLLGTTMEMVPP